MSREQIINCKLSTICKMFEFIKDWQRKRLLRQLEHKDSNRNKKIDNIAQAKSIGIIFQVGDENDWNLIYHFAKLMEKEGKTVAMIGLQDSETELDYIITHSNTLLCKEKDDFDYWGVPKKDLVEKFAKNHFELLIDTTEEPNFFGQYIALSCDADLKICYASAEELEDNGKIFDMMIQGEEPLNLRDYLNQVVKYLKMIKKE